MERVYVPYINERPLTISIKGHKVLIVTEDVGDIESLLSRLSEFDGFNSQSDVIFKLNNSILAEDLISNNTVSTSNSEGSLANSMEIRDLECDSPEDKAFLVEQIAASEKAHVIFASEGDSIYNLIEYIESNLPWIH
jgi:hypothetical protein